MKKCFFIICLLIFLIGCRGFAFRVPSVNMLPAIKAGETCIVDQYSATSVQRFDIVMFKAPEWTEQISEDKGEVKYISRIIGLPGENIQIKDNKVFINGNLLDEPYEKITDVKDKAKDFPAMMIPENEYFILGDNRPYSLDSRYWKPSTIKKENILGKVIKILPIDVRK